jgi:hypothetical protein
MIHRTRDRNKITNLPKYMLFDRIVPNRTIPGDKNGVMIPSKSLPERARWTSSATGAAAALLSGAAAGEGASSTGMSWRSSKSQSGDGGARSHDEDVTGSGWSGGEEETEEK